LPSVQAYEDNGRGEYENRSITFAFLLSSITELTELHGQSDTSFALLHEIINFKLQKIMNVSVLCHFKHKVLNALFTYCIYLQTYLEIYHGA
jgi:hypothetical protein